MVALLYKYALLLLILLQYQTCLGWTRAAGAASRPGRTSTRLSAAAAAGSRSYDLVVWDCDGVLVDSEALLKQGEVEALAELGYKLTVDDCTRLFSGVSPDEAEKNFEREMKASLPSDFFRKQIDGSMDLFRRRLKPLMTPTVLALHKQGVRQCVASGSPRDRVLLCLELAGIRHCFPDETVFTRELVKRGKPAPDLFLYAADKMGAAATRCVVIEDAVSGIEAANAAKMPVLAFLGGGHAQPTWYREKIISYRTPVFDTHEDILAKLSSL